MGSLQQHSTSPVSPISISAAAMGASDRPAISNDHPLVINLDHGDPTMYEKFWKKAGDEATLVISGWETMSYFSNKDNVCWFLERGFEEEVRRLHEFVGNAVVDGKHIIVGTGSTQLFQAALFALSDPNSDQPANVVSSVPYYSVYPVATDYLKSRLYQWAGDVEKYQGEGSYIELVCSPNNPDGLSKQAVLSSENGKGKTIHDLAYYWPQYTAITAAADHDIMLFTISKTTGHAGIRIGWALVKDDEVARKMIKFIEMNTIGVSKDSQIRAARILSVVRNSHDNSKIVHSVEESFFHYARRTMTERWDRLNEAIKSSNGAFILADFPSQHCNFSDEIIESHPAFAWMKCEKEGIDDFYGFLKKHNILTRGGEHFGVEKKYVRISMLDRDPMFDIFINRMSIIH
ncbi:Alliinase family protein [Zostera marina]|uniref:Alliinase family protein n=1 Tax=Zostera marina TaxID=29655 RepID=A0A0K9PNB5_ZOSMR|nr:Alliinase family protein [Zostera marina]